jgi:hypothetical protein
VARPRRRIAYLAKADCRLNLPRPSSMTASGQKQLPTFMTAAAELASTPDTPRAGGLITEGRRPLT